MPLIIGLYVMDLYATNTGLYAFMPLIIGLCPADLSALNYWIVYCGFVCN